MLLFNWVEFSMSWGTGLTWQLAQQRAAVLKKIRTFFAKRNVVEVETPLMSKGTVTDVHLDAFSTRYNFSIASDTDTKEMYLQTSPEFAMKRLLASGYGCIYQICKAFRHEPYGRHHNPEFTMLEWYRVGYDHFDLMKEVADLLQQVLACQKPVQKTYQELFKQYVGLDPLVAKKSQLLEYISRHGKLSDWLMAEDSIDILLQFILSEFIEPKIALDRPYFIYNFPRSQASLAKLCTKDNRVAERFECYYLGVELANGFNELTDAKEQVSRFKQDNRDRKSRGLPQRAIDKNFVSALEQGLPDCAGVALGVDRLLMLACNAGHIDEVLSFPIERS